MSIDIGQVATDAGNEILRVLRGTAKDIGGYAKAEAKKLATSAVEIAQLRLTNQIDEEEMRLHLDIQKHASRSVLMAIEGVSIVGAEQAINAALTVIGKAVQGAIGIALPI
jgi:hypothetical protein